MAVGHQNSRSRPARIDREIDSRYRPVGRNIRPNRRPHPANLDKKTRIQTIDTAITNVSSA